MSADPGRRGDLPLAGLTALVVEDDFQLRAPWGTTR
jgi:hypothetical protein